MKRPITAIIILMLPLLSACSNPYPPITAPSENEHAAENNTHPGIEVIGENGDDGTDVPNAEEEATKPNPDIPKEDEDTPQASPSDSKLYRMNQVYRFVPLAEDVPEKAVLLTFDDGPKEEKLLEQMLSTLDKHKAKAIFFVNGYRVKANPELLQMIHARGHAIGNHSWDHIDLKKQEHTEVLRQIKDVQDIVLGLTGESPRFFRPPFGSGSDFVKQTAKDHDMLYMTWSNGSLDWDKSTKDNPEAVIKNVMDQLHPGANILMHELQWTADALDGLLNKLKDSGYGFIDPAAIETEQQPSGNAE
ncbi:polysaccharide deacetylase family protein [Paenibacillus tarimensis]